MVLASPTSHIDPVRRRWLRAGLALAAFSLSGASARMLAPDTRGAYPFTLGVASGDPTADGFVLWTRLAPEPAQIDGGMPPYAVPVTWEVAEDEGFRRLVRSELAQARPERAHAVHVDVAGLQSARSYFYRFRVGDAVSATGRVRTLPAPGLPLPEAERAALDKELAALTPRLAKAGPHAADAQVFAKAVAYALRFDEFYDLAKDVPKAHWALAQAAERLDHLDAAPWAQLPGPQALAYVSAVDGSVQPYGVVIPEHLPAG